MYEGHEKASKDFAKSIAIDPILRQIWFDNLSKLIKVSTSRIADGCDVTVAAREEAEAFIDGWILSSGYTP